MLKEFWWQFRRNVFFALAHLFPVKKNRILFTSYDGRQYSCNPKYITEYLLENRSNKFDIVWAYNGDEKYLSKRGITVIKYMSFRYCFYYLTSKFIVSNQKVKSSFKRKSSQMFLPTWHGGGAYKRVEFDTETDGFMKYKYTIMGKEVDYYISSCKRFTECMSGAHVVQENKFMRIGMPRNDLFLYSDIVSAHSKRIREKYNLGKKVVVLYAPTWRDDGRSQDIEQIKTVINNFDRNKYCLLCRAHHAGGLTKDNNVIDVTSYPDMQELLCAADILITDYSSCMWDFSLMYKPCFIYATDIDKYKHERDFYTPMSEWPFPIATNAEELINNIKNFDEVEYKEKVKQHHLALGSYEDGHATEKVCKLIEKICFGEDEQ